MIGIMQLDQSRASLFTEAEKNEFIDKECILIADAKQDIVHPLLKFWEGKRKLMIHRVNERGIPFVKVPV